MFKGLFSSGPKKYFPGNGIGLEAFMFSFAKA